MLLFCFRITSYTGTSLSLSLLSLTPDHKFSRSTWVPLEDQEIRSVDSCVILGVVFVYWVERKGFLFWSLLPKGLQTETLETGDGFPVKSGQYGRVSVVQTGSEIIRDSKE